MFGCYKGEANLILDGKQAEFIDAVKSNKKYIVVEAPAGTGKTFSCIQAVKALTDMRRLESYQKVLILTFSRNARAQLLKELSKFPLDDEIYKHIDVNNYHSFFKKYLDAYRDIIGIKNPLCVKDDEDFFTELIAFAQEKGVAIDQSLKCTILDDSFMENGKLVAVNQKSKIKQQKYPKVEELLKLSFLFTQETGAICFAQFGSLVHKILSRIPEMKAAISHDYPVLILDEYQDTNYFQEFFVRGVLENSAGIFFCDRYQMIYDFRGSTLKRIEELPTLYPGITKIEFDEYFRYKDKEDIVKLLNDIRGDKAPDYSQLSNGGLLSVSVDCNSNWRKMKNAKSQKMQCTLYCNAILYKTIRTIKSALQNKKSIAILCRNNIEVNKLVELFFEKGFHPKEITDTKNMTLAAKHLKELTQNCTPVKENIVRILSIALLCTSKKVLFGDTLEDISQLTYKSFCRKTKSGYKRLKALISPNAEIYDYRDIVNLILKILCIIEYEGDSVTFSMKKFVEQCANLIKPTPETIDGVMLQRQYTNSFTNITPGLYITTIHQSKGKEFDYVIVADVSQLNEDKNLLYVSHSRMKERLYPISVTYNGPRYGGR